MVNDQATKDELQEELRRRDLPVSGTKRELQQRLQEAADDASAGQEGGDRQRAPGPGDDAEPSGSGPRGATAGPNDGAPPALEIARRGARQLAMLTRRQVEAISGLCRVEEGWRVDVEVVEVDRVPSSTDVMATYAVYVDDRGDLISYERVERFVRGQASGGEG